MIAVKDITIVIVTYNAKSYLVKCIDSVHKYIYEDLKGLIVVDDNSNDGTKILMETRYPHVQYILNPNNIGYGASVNVALKKINTKYILVLNADIEFTDNRIYKLIEYMESNNSIGLMGCSYLNTDGTKQYSGILKPNRSLLFYVVSALLGKYMPRRFKYLTDENIINSTRKISMVQGACMLLRMEALKDIGGFDDNLYLFGEERDLAERMRKKPWLIYIDPNVKVIHHGSISINQESERCFIEKHRSEYYLFRKHNGFIHAALYRFMVAVKYSKYLIGKSSNNDKEIKLFKWAIGKDIL